MKIKRHIYRIYNCNKISTLVQDWILNFRKIWAAVGLRLFNIWIGLNLMPMRSVWILLPLLYAKSKVNSQARMLNSSVIATSIDLNNIILSQSLIASFDSDLNCIYLICLSSKQTTFMFYFLELFKQCWEVCVYSLQKPFTD